MRKQTDRALLDYILNDIEEIKCFIVGVDFETFKLNAMVRKAVCMSLINIGELTGRLTEELKERHTDIPWESVRGLRNVTAHGYHELSLTVIWDTVIHDIPMLENVVIYEIKQSV